MGEKCSVCSCTSGCSLIFRLKVCCWQLHNQPGGREETPAAAQLCDWVVCLCKHGTRLHEEEAAAVLARPDLLECWPCLPYAPGRPTRGREGSFNLSAGGNGSTLALAPCKVHMGAVQKWAPGCRAGVGSSNCAAADSFCATMRAWLQPKQLLDAQLGMTPLGKRTQHNNTMKEGHTAA